MLHLLRRLPWPVGLTAILLGGGYLLGNIALVSLLHGRASLPAMIDRTVWGGSITFSVLIFMLDHVERATEAMLRAIRPALLVDERVYQALCDRCRRVTGAERRVTVSVALVILLGLSNYISRVPDPVLRVYGALGLVLVTLMLAALGAAIMRGLRASRRVQTLPLAIDIFDSDDLTPLARHALHISLVGAVLVAISIVIWGFEAGVIAVLLYGGLLGLSALAFFVPLQGLRRRMTEAKAKELEAVQTRVRLAYQRLHASSPADEPEAARTLAYLLAAEQRVLAAPTWPFDTVILGQLFVTLLFPLGLAVLQVWLGRL